ncbi:MAG TPA: lipoprotein LpqH [Mycobacterium sp.]|nr:lipoprotein LpqH [Mycobacterium sp.]
MNRRCVAVATLLLLVVTGCSGRQVAGQANASISIDGQSQGQAQTVRCNQAQSSWFIDIGNNGSSASAIVDVTGGKVNVDTVTIRGYGGFTGGYWKGGEQSADATLSNLKFTISGTATGLKTGTPGSVDAKFKIDAHC